MIMTTAARSRATTITVVTITVARRTTTVAARHTTSARYARPFGYFVRGAPPPPGIHLERGRPLPHGYYGERLDGRALSRLPVYPGYEWRRAGGDIVLIAVGTGIVYEILDGVLY
jgi:Ni/Co efflux regulator RcnB